MKDIGSLFKKMSDNERAVLQRIVDHSYKRFKTIVKDGRGLSASQVDLIATGEVWNAADAGMLGLIDETGYVNRAVDVAMELTGVNTPVVLTYEEELTFWDVFGARSPVVSLIRGLDNTVNNLNTPAPKLFYMWIP